MLHAKISHWVACTCTHSVKNPLPVAPEMPPGLFLSICGDRMTIRPPATQTELCWNTHTCAQTHARRRSSTEICRLPPEKQRVSCLSNWHHSRRQNKQALLHGLLYLAAPLPPPSNSVGFQHQVVVNKSFFTPGQSKRLEGGVENQHPRCQSQLRSHKCPKEAETVDQPWCFGEVGVALRSM